MKPTDASTYQEYCHLAHIYGQRDRLAEWEWDLLYGPVTLDPTMHIHTTSTVEPYLKFTDVRIDTWKVEGDFLVFESRSGIHYIIASTVIHFWTV